MAFLVDCSVFHKRASGLRTPESEGRVRGLTFELTGPLRRVGIWARIL